MQNKQIFNLSNGLKIISYQKEYTYNNTTKLFDILEIKDKKKELVHIEKILKVNGKNIEKDWNW